MVTQEDGSGAASEAVGCHRGRGLLVGRGARAWRKGLASKGRGLRGDMGVWPQWEWGVTWNEAWGEI